MIRILIYVVQEVRQNIGGNHRQRTKRIPIQTSFKIFKYYYYFSNPSYHSRPSNSFFVCHFQIEYFYKSCYILLHGRRSSATVSLSSFCLMLVRESGHRASRVARRGVVWCGVRQTVQYWRVFILTRCRLGNGMGMGWDGESFARHGTTM